MDNLIKPAGITDNTEIILLPLNIDNIHWTMVILSLRDKVIEFYDSFGRDLTTTRRGWISRLIMRLCYLYPFMPKLQQWTNMNCTKGHILQTDGHSCGLFAMYFAYLRLVRRESCTVLVFSHTLQQSWLKQHFREWIKNWMKRICLESETRFYSNES